MVDEHDGVTSQGAELADPQPGAGQHLDDEATDRVGVDGCAHQLRGVGVGEELRERSVRGWEIPVEDQHPPRRVRVAPFRDPFEERPQRAERHPDRRVGQRRPATATRKGRQEPFERFDMAPLDIDQTVDFGMVRHEPAAEAAQHHLSGRDRCRPQRHGDLIQIAPHRPSQHRSPSGDDVPLRITGTRPTAVVIDGECSRGGHSPTPSPTVTKRSASMTVMAW